MASLEMNLKSPENARFKPLLSAEDAKRQARVLKAFSDPTRLRILSLLLEHEDLMNVDDLRASVGRIAQPTMSHHLRILRDSGLVVGRKYGLETHYMVKRDKLVEAEAIIWALKGEAK